MGIRNSFMFSIIRQLSGHSSAYVRRSVERDRARLIRLFDSSTFDKFDELLPIVNGLIFDQDGAVQSTALEEFAPTVLVLLQAT